ncbi:MAG: glycosyltransferase family 4 protein [Gammaproteobacteria bacterium]|nr:glycosyltransferase family 4 protein [Gammaproteobacteria bacterium]
MPPRLAIVLKGYPRLSETFIAQEIRALEMRGFELCIFSLRHPYDPASHPIHAEIEAPVYYLPEYVHDDPSRVLGAALRLCWKAGFWRALLSFGADLLHEPTRNRMRRFAQALVMAREMPSSVEHYYAHFMHTPSSVCYYASIINRQSWSISAHAKDVWTISERELRKKLSASDWVVTCTAANASYLSSLSTVADKVSLLYHGLDFSRFDRNDAVAAERDGNDADDAVRLISVGRAVDKKGYDVLLAALAELPPTLCWRFVHIGGGELFEALQAQARVLGLEDRIEWLGALPQTEVLAQYRKADLFVLPSKISADGDRDGLPNVLMEAQSQALACLSTNISGIPELIIHAESGWLVEQKDNRELAAALERLISDPELRSRLGQAGYARVTQEFSMERGIDKLVQRLQQSVERGHGR